eukprot:gene25827-11502_t
MRLRLLFKASKPHARDPKHLEMRSDSLLQRVQFIYFHILLSPYASLAACACVGRMRLRLLFKASKPHALDPKHLEMRSDSLLQRVGRMRLRLLFKASKPHALDPKQLEQWVHVIGLPPAKSLVKKYGQTMADPGEHGGYLPAQSKDPWGRAPAFMGHDNEAEARLMWEPRVYMAGRFDEAGASQLVAMAAWVDGYDNEAEARLMWEPRVYMAGLSDEAGASQLVAMAVKQLGSPSKDEIQKLEDYVHETLFQHDGSGQLKGGIQKTAQHFLQNNGTYEVKASMLYYDPDDSSLVEAEGQPGLINKCKNSGIWWQICWDKKRASETWRAYNNRHAHPDKASNMGLVLETSGKT